MDPTCLFTMTLIGFCGSANAGKDTCGEFLVHHGFKRVSFATSLKDVVSILFGWNRTMLEGLTAEDRQAREVVDTFWSKVFGRPVTPRSMLQQIGTDVVRNHLHQDMWVQLVKKNILDKHYGEHIVITDVRFENEIKMIEGLGGQVVRVVRGPTPQWETDLLDGKDLCDIEDLPHESEYAWTKHVTSTIDNNSSIKELHEKLKVFLTDC